LNLPGNISTFAGAHFGGIMHGDELKPAPLWANLAASLTRRMPRARYRLIERLCRGSSERFAAKMAKQLGGYTFDCSLRDRMARDVFFAGCFANQEVAFVRGVLKAGMCFVDVGANWGLFTLVASHLVGTSGRVVALEPDPRMFAKLTANVGRNHLHQVKLFELAAADCDSELVLAPHDQAGENWGISRLVEPDLTNAAAFHVRARRLDSLLNEAGVRTVELVKIDVEGAEALVLAGMEQGLRDYRYRRILLELHPVELAERRRTTRDVIAALLQRGYKGYALDNSEQAGRRAYYHPWLHFSEFIRPLDEGMKNPQPHTVWLSPDEPDLM